MDYLVTGTFQLRISKRLKWLSVASRRKEDNRVAAGRVAVGHDPRKGRRRNAGVSGKENKREKKA